MSALSLEYTKALYELASNREEKEVLLFNLFEISKVFNDTDILKFFTYPETSIKLKKEFINKDIKEGLFKNFIYVLIDNRRIELLPEISIDFENLFFKEFNVIRAQVYSKNLLSEDYKNKLKEKLEAKTKKEIIIENIIDDSISAGVRIEYESNIIDLTVDKKLNDLISNLKE